jgi:hypothetical protein
MRVGALRITTGRVSLSVALVALAAASYDAQARQPRGPAFGGVQSATTCIPGPAGAPGQTSSYRLVWEAASERPRLARTIVYEVYQATSPGGENFAVPTYTTARRATSFQTPELAAQGTYFFVVRARDRAGREDKNTVEREGQNVCV